MQRLRTCPEHVAFEVRGADGAVTDPWRQVTTRQFVDEVRALAKGLIAAGLQPGESLAIMSPTRYEWALADMAAWFAAAVVVPIYETSAAPQVNAILADADVRLAVAGAAGHAALLEEGFASAGTPGLGVWTMDSRPGADLAALVLLGAGVPDSAVEERRLLADLDSVATIVYTSGTTAAPKGALITHGNFVGQVLNVAAAYTGVVREGGNTIIFLPMAHVLARGLQLICLANGMRIAHLSDPRDVVPALGALKPTFLVVVPRVLQKIQASAAGAAAAKRLGRAWAAAQRTAVEWGRFAEAYDADPSVRAPLGLRARRALFDRLFYARLRTLVGGRLDYLLSGAVALDAELYLFFRGLGLPVIEGYGLTETTAPLTGNLPGAISAGSVGVPMPGTTVRISDQGEVLARGVGVFAGYRRASDNADAFTDGFFRTGDLGSMDGQGRIKDVIVTAGGKTISL
ncbi:MAG: AMP-binding protein, partial [Pseudarthrobacter sp.]